MASQFNNRSNADLADEYGTLDGQIKALTERKDAIKEEFKARSVDRVEGPKFTITVSEQSAKRLDTKALKAALGDDICAEYEKESFSTVVRVKATVVFGHSVAAE